MSCENKLCRIYNLENVSLYVYNTDLLEKIIMINTYYYNNTLLKLKCEKQMFTIFPEYFQQKMKNQLR